MNPYVLYKALSECALDVPTKFRIVNEATQVRITDEVMGEMFKFVSEKYTSLDFSEIEKSNGDITKFKYYSLLQDNLKLLNSIYVAHDSKVYSEYVNKMENIIAYLESHSKDINYLYAKRNGIMQMFYVSTVAALMYGVSALISMTIQFVTDSETADINVFVEEIPNPQKYIHLKNIDTAYLLITDGTIDKLGSEYMKSAKANLNEAVAIPIALGAPAIAVLSIPVIIYLSTKIIPFIREVIYSIYFTRVKWENVLEIQVSLIKTNIESLESGRGSKRVIATQKNIVKKLEKLKDIIMVKSDKAQPVVKKTIEKENKEIKIEQKFEEKTSSDELKDILL